VKATEILEQYRHGERQALRGPLTYDEAHSVVSLNERMLAALKELVSVPHGSGAKALQARMKARCRADAVIADAEGA
jgi:hypothetical protein